MRNLAVAHGPGSLASSYPPKIGYGTRNAFGAGAIANGVKNAGLAIPGIQR